MYRTGTKYVCPSAKHAHTSKSSIRYIHTTYIHNTYLLLLPVGLGSRVVGEVVGVALGLLGGLGGGLGLLAPLVVLRRQLRVLCAVCVVGVVCSVRCVG